MPPEATAGTDMAAIARCSLEGLVVVAAEPKRSLAGSGQVMVVQVKEQENWPHGIRRYEGHFGLDPVEEKRQQTLGDQRWGLVLEK